MDPSHPADSNQDKSRSKMTHPNTLSAQFSKPTNDTQINTAIITHLLPLNTEFELTSGHLTSSSTTAQFTDFSTQILITPTSPIQTTNSISIPDSAVSSPPTQSTLLVVGTSAAGFGDVSTALGQDFPPSTVTLSASILVFVSFQSHGTHWQTITVVGLEGTSTSSPSLGTPAIGSSSSGTKPSILAISCVVPVMLVITGALLVYRRRRRRRRLLVHWRERGNSEDDPSAGEVVDDLVVRPYNLAPSSSSFFQSSSKLSLISTTSNSGTQNWRFSGRKGLTPLLRTGELSTASISPRPSPISPATTVGPNLNPFSDPSSEGMCTGDGVQRSLSLQLSALREQINLVEYMARSAEERRMTDARVLGTEVAPPGYDI